MRKLNLAAAIAALSLTAQPAAAAQLLSINLYHGDSNGNCADTVPGSGCSPIGVTQAGALDNPFLNNTGTKAISLAPGSYYLFANPYAGTNFMVQGATISTMMTAPSDSGGSAILMLGNATVPDLSVAGLTLFNFAKYGVKITTTGITTADRMSFGYPPGAFKPDGNTDFVLRLDYLVPGSAVPEPAAWAMMIAGFGLAGAALRRRRGVVVA